ncbi:MAG: glutamine-hydrolyzing GMP synthase, partial [Verrucomicrobiota bacterium]
MEQIVILDFGSQYTQVIARRVRECNVYSTIVRYDTPASEIAAMNPKGLILSGGPSSVYAQDAPLPDKAIFKLGIPVLGICYGVQLLAHYLGGKVERGDKREYGKGNLNVADPQCALFKGLPRQLQVWNSHGDKLTRLPKDFVVVGTTENSDYAAIENSRRRFFGIQFHPEVVHSPRGREIIANYVHGVCGCGRDWTMRNYVEQATEDIRDKVGKDRVILGLSGGVDSSVAAALIHRAIGDQLTCVFVDHGLLRLNEGKMVMEMFAGRLHAKVIHVDATEQFMGKLDGVADPEAKRKIIGKEFVEVFQAEAKKLSNAKWLAQGTIYPDVIESGGAKSKKAVTIKSHHNVGGLPETLGLKLLEPLRDLFKDEVRELGVALGLPHDMVYRHPFPGPGLGVRILGAVNQKYADLLRQADAIFIEELRHTKDEATGKTWYDLTS